jgi:hypothetical protein
MKLNRQLLVDVIEKYHLGGLCEQVRWKINENKLQINFATILKDCIGEIKCEVELENSELGVYDTTQFYKLVKIIKDPININIVKKDNKALKLEISDSNFDLFYHLGDLGLISEGNLTNELPEPVISLDLSSEFSDKFIKAHNALEKAEKFQLKTEITKQKENTVKFVIGLTDKFSNKISFNEITTEYSELPTFTYNVMNFREILNNNKDSKLSMYVYTMGIVRIDSIKENMNVSYYLVPNRN